MGLNLLIAADRVYALCVTDREMWFMLDEKERVDAIDEQEGQVVQNMVGAVHTISSVTKKRTINSII